MNDSREEEMPLPQVMEDTPPASPDNDKSKDKLVRHFIKKSDVTVEDIETIPPTKSARPTVLKTSDGTTYRAPNRPPIKPRLGVYKDQTKIAWDFK